MNDPDLGNALGDSLRHRVRPVSRQPDVGQLLHRLERRARRQRRVLLGGLVAVLGLGAIVGYAAGRSTTSTETAIVALNDGVPDATSGDSALEPENADAAVAAIEQAFHDAYAGGTPDAVRRAAIQRAREIEDFRSDTLANAESRGYTAEQLAGTTIAVLDTRFVDATHAVAHFTLTIPGHGAVLVDQVGYAVFDNGRWQVALRTACDLLSLAGLGRQCPPGGR